MFNRAGIAPRFSGGLMFNRAGIAPRFSGGLMFSEASPSEQSSGNGSGGSPSTHALAGTAQACSGLRSGLPAAELHEVSLHCGNARLAVHGERGTMCVV